MTFQYKVKMVKRFTLIRKKFSFRLKIYCMHYNTATWVYDKKLLDTIKFNCNVAD